MAKTRRLQFRTDEGVRDLCFIDSTEELHVEAFSEYCRSG